MNLTEKIISSHLVQGEAKEGNEIALGIDQTLTQDALGMLAYIAFESFGIPQVRTQCSVSYLDHNMVYLDHRNPDDHAYLISMGKKYGIRVSRPGNGICHLVHSGRFALPGRTLLGTDSHTPTSGALGMLALGAGGIDVAAAMAGEPFYLKMPRVVNVRLTGSFKPGVGAKDLALAIAGRFTVKGGTGCVLEYTGPALGHLTVPQRMTLANMGAETGATSSIFPSDEQTRIYLKAQGREADFLRLAADPGAEYGQVVEFDLPAGPRDTGPGAERNPGEPGLHRQLHQQLLQRLKNSRPDSEGAHGAGSRQPGGVPGVPAELSDDDGGGDPLRFCAGRGQDSGMRLRPLRGNGPGGPERRGVGAPRQPQFLRALRHNARPRVPGGPSAGRSS